MKRIMIAALAVLLLVSVSVGGVLPVYAESAPMHAHAHSESEEASTATGATPLDEPMGPDYDSYKPSLVPMGAKPIGNAMEFATMEPDGTYYLTADFTLSASYEATFTGTLYGKGHTITTSVPLFKYLQESEIHDLTIEGEIVGSGVLGAVAIQGKAPRLYRVINNADITSTNGQSIGGMIGNVWNHPGRVVFSYCENNGDLEGTAGYNDAGGLVAYMQGNGGDSQSSLLVEHCLNTGNIHAGKRLGGLIGCAGQYAGDNNHFYAITIVNCKNTGEITAKTAAEDQGYYSGGLVSRLSALNVYVANSINEGDVYTHKSYGGGLFALAEEADCTLTVVNCRNEGNVQTAGQSGGIIAIINKSTVRAYFYGCSNTGAISSSASANVSGLVGSVVCATLVVDNGINEGTVTATTGTGSAGGIVGAVTGDVTITNSTNSNTINGASSGVGGILGWSKGNINIYNCVNENTVTGTGNCGAGGIVGLIATDTVCAVSVELCRNDADITGGRPGGIFGVYEISDANAGDATTKSGATGYFADCVNNGKVVSPTNYGAGIAARFDTELASADGLNGEYADPVVFVNCVNNGEVEAHHYHVGGLLGYCRGKGVTALYGCANNGYIHYEGLDSTTGNAGGLGGSMDVKMYLEDCVNTGVVYNGKPDAAAGNNFVGGMIGYCWNAVTIKNCVNYADLTGNGVGGMTGKVTGGWLTIDGAVNHGTITAFRNGGGISSEASSGVTANACVNTGEVTGGYHAGGIICHAGVNGNLISNSVNHGDVNGSCQTGGIAGSFGGNNGTQSIISCVNTGDVHNDAVKATDKSHATGGIAGYIYNVGRILYCASLGDVSADYNNASLTGGTELVAGGIVGYQNEANTSTYQYNYFAGTIDAGEHGTAVLLKNTIGTSLSGVEATKLTHNFSVNSYPLYYHKLSGVGTVSTTMSTPSPPIRQVLSSLIL